jgi:hypothetical protein
MVQDRIERLPNLLDAIASKASRLDRKDRKPNTEGDDWTQVVAGGGEPIVG